MKRIFIVITLSILWNIGFGADIYDKLQKAYKNYQKKKYQEALKLYLDAQIDMPDDPMLNFNTGVSLYKTKKYKQALECFYKALKSDDKKFRAKVWYNIGNCLVRMGNLQDALVAYRRALQLDNKDKDIKYNMQYVQQQLKQLLNQKKKEKQQKDPLKEAIKELEKLINRQSKLIIETQKNKEALASKQEKLATDTTKNKNKFKKILDVLRNSKKTLNKKTKDISQRIENAIKYIDEAIPKMFQAHKNLKNKKNKKAEDYEKKALEDLIKARLQFSNQPPPQKKTKQRNKNSKSSQNSKSRSTKKKSNKNKKQNQNLKKKKEKMDKIQINRILNNIEEMEKKFRRKHKRANPEEYEVEKYW